MSKYQHSLFLFHRDLRLHDNTGLLAAQKSSAKVTPIFIFETSQIIKHPYRSDPGFLFLVQSLAELQGEIAERGGRLLIAEGITARVVRELIATLKADAFFSNRDYTPFARRRDEEISKECERAHLDFHLLGDSLLHEPEDLLKDNGKPYTVYTPYAKKAATRGVRAPVKNEEKNLTSLPPLPNVETSLEKFLPKDGNFLYAGGRRACKEILKGVQRFATLKETRDFPALDSTTKLSPHLKFGTCSCREIFHTISRKLSPDHTIIKELYWRDFFSQIAFFFPHVFGAAFHPAYDKIEWDNDEEKFARWKEGQTGFPIVDAGMRELNATGFMHNRVRMITASFLVKDLHIDWRWGERYFAQRLVDYDPSVNNGNWQWVASSGCDAQPYFRIFNPWLQQERFDPECRYIKRWVKELEVCAPSSIHQGARGGLAGIQGYPAPLVDHGEEKKVTEERYSVVKSRVLKSE